VTSSFTRTSRGTAMKLLTNRNGSFLTGDELADAVLRYGLALARKREIDVVDIPFRTPDGALRRVQLSVGWNVDTTAISSGPDGTDELVEHETARSMDAKAAAADILRGHPFSADESMQMHRQLITATGWV
jgi:hypothetical protein